MSRYVVVNDSFDATIWRVTSEVGFNVGLIDAELEIKNPNLDLTVQWTDKSLVKSPKKIQLENFRIKLGEKVLDF